MAGDKLLKFDGTRRGYIIALKLMPLRIECDASGFVKKEFVNE